MGREIKWTNSKVLDLQLFSSEFKNTGPARRESLFEFCYKSTRPSYYSFPNFSPSWLTVFIETRSTSTVWIITNQLLILILSKVVIPLWNFDLADRRYHTYQILVYNKKWKVDQSPMSGIIGTGVSDCVCVSSDNLCVLACTLPGWETVVRILTVD